MGKLAGAALALLVIAPVGTFAQTAGAPSPVPARAAGATAPSGTDTPLSPVAGTRSEPANTSLPTVDGSGVNQSSDSSATGAVMPPVGAPRLPGVPLDPPTGPTAPP